MTYKWLSIFVRFLRFLFLLGSLIKGHFDLCLHLSNYQKYMCLQDTHKVTGLYFLTVIFIFIIFRLIFIS